MALATCRMAAAFHSYLTLSLFYRPVISGTSGTAVPYDKVRYASLVALLTQDDRESQDPPLHEVHLLQYALMIPSGTFCFTNALAVALCRALSTVFGSSS